VSTEISTEAEFDLLELLPGGPSVVAMGGGHGLAQVLEAVQSYASAVAGVVTVADDGGSSGRLTKAMPIPPPGDVRKCLLALSPEPTIWRELFSYRFDESDVAGHSLGNLILAALTDLLGDFEAAVRTAGSMLGARGRVLPAARQSLHLQAVVDGVVVDGQAEINKSPGRIEELRLVPGDAAANPEAMEAIAGADQIVIGPGSLYTSVISALMVPGITEAMDRARGSLVLVLNLVTQDAESLGLNGPDHVRELQRIAGLRRTGTILANDGPMTVPGSVEQVMIDEAEAAALGWDLATGDLVDRDADWPQHDPIRLGEALARLT
jgi:uncharacterized cofD-like protein